jgi:eukaryotic-like serine/threonine-protein kinase
MDSAQAKLFAEQLLSEAHIDQWELTNFIGYGKSSVVMSAVSGEHKVAVKVFHPEIVERFGLQAQVIRINREKLLINNDHPSIVKIIDGGVSKDSNHPYIVMELISGEILSNLLEKIPRENIKLIIEQLARATKHIEDFGVVHRDIKPENIIITDSEYTKIKLLDFGVMRPVGDSSATDQPGHRPFVGTHQYSPPEMLHRNEEDTVEGWRSITFYQIGAVLHDLIMREPIFESHKEPYANLVIAVDNIRPKIDAEDVEPELISLAKRCLLKKPYERSRAVEWKDFLFSAKTNQPTNEDRLNTLKKKQQLSKAIVEMQGLARIEANRVKDVKLDSLRQNLRDKVEIVLERLADVLPPKTIKSLHQIHPNTEIICHFPADKSLNLSTNFHFELSFYNEPESSFVEIYVRAGTGEVGNEITWVHLGGFLDQLDDFEPVLEEWLINLLELLINN